MGQFALAGGQIWTKANLRDCHLTHGATFRAFDLP